MSFLDTDFNIPNHYLRLLEFWYGKDWRIPQSNSPSNDEDPRGTFLRSICGSFFGLFIKSSNKCWKGPAPNTTPYICLLILFEKIVKS